MYEVNYKIRSVCRSLIFLPLNVTITYCRHSTVDWCEKYLSASSYI